MAVVAGSYQPTGVSAEFAAGHAHGAALATQHAGTGGAAGSAGAAPYSIDAITQQARQLAGSDTQSQIQTIHDQQQQLLQQASDRAGQINQASAALAKMQAGIGNQTAASYRTAAKDEAGFANGYSGDLRSTASDAAAKVLANLSAVGGSADQIKNPGQGNELGNVLYGLGGQMPASLLTTSGQAFAAAQRQLPGSTRGYGEQQAIGALGAGRQASDALIQQILDAKAGEPKLASQYASQLTSAAQNAALFPYLLGKDQNAAIPAGYTRDPSTGNIIQKPGTPRTVSPGSTLVDPNTGQVIYKAPPKATGAPRFSASNSRAVGYRVDQNGNPIGGKITPLPGFRVTASGGVVKVGGASTKQHGLTASEVNRQTGIATTLAQTAFHGGTDKKGNPLPPLTFAQAVLEAVKEGIPAWIYLPALRSFYNPGGTNSPTYGPPAPQGR